MKRILLILFLFLIVIIENITAQNFNAKVLFLEDSITISEFDNSSNKTLLHYESIKLPHCSEIIFTPDYKGFYLNINSPLEELLSNSVEKYIVVILYKGNMNFSTGGDNIKSIIIINDFIDIPKALSKNECIDHYITDKLNYFLKKPEQFHQEAFSEVYFVNNDKIFLKVNEKLRVVFNKKVPYLGMKKFDCE